MNITLAWSREAKADVDDIWFGIAVDSLDAARSVIEEISAQADRLIEFPRIGRSRDEIGTDLRSVLVRRSYLLIYRLDEANERVEIVRIIHGKRNLSALFD